MKTILSILKKLFKKSSQGFTLIELLVVIGILGVLASALIATIDPFEQIKKGNDANIKNALVEYLNSNVRYYSTHNAFPWDSVANGGAACNAGAAPNSTTNISVAPLSTCTQTLIDDKELKPGFITSTSLTKEIFATYDAADNILIGCFRPQSNSQRRDKGTVYDKAGANVVNPTTACEGYGGTTLCYWCTQ